MKNSNTVRFIIATVVAVVALVLAIVFPFVKSPEAVAAVTLFDLPLVGTIEVSRTLQIILNVVVAFIFLLYFVFEILRGRIKLVRSLKFAGFSILAALGAFLFGLLVTYISSLGAGIEFKFLAPLAYNGASKLIMILSAVLMLAMIAVLYWKSRAEVVRDSMSSMRSSAAYNAAGKYALTTAYGVMFLQLIIGGVLLGLVGDNQLFFIPLACGTIALAFWRMTNLKFLFPFALFLLVLHSASVLGALAVSMTIGVFPVLLADAALDFILAFSLADLYVLSRK